MVEAEPAERSGHASSMREDDNSAARVQAQSACKMVGPTQRCEEMLAPGKSNQDLFSFGAPGDQTGLSKGSVP